MKQLMEDTLKLGGALQAFVLAPTPMGRLHRQVRISRPNWSLRECFRAAKWLRRNGLRVRAGYFSAEERSAHIQQLLNDYCRQLHGRAAHPVADELALSRWEARWSKARSRRKPQHSDAPAKCGEAARDAA